jgi:hypothetical protein
MGVNMGHPPVIICLSYVHISRADHVIWRSRLRLCPGPGQPRQAAHRYRGFPVQKVGHRRAEDRVVHPFGAAHGAHGDLNQTSFGGTYTIQEGETDSADLTVTAVSLTGGATLAANDDGVPADLSLPAGQNLGDNQNIVVDASTPAALLPDLNAASDTGSSDTDNLTNIATPTVSGTTEAGATVNVRVGGASVGTTTADGTGAWTFTFDPGDLSEGANTIDIIASDVVNTSADSPDLTVTLDTTVPTAVDDTTASVGEGDGDTALTGVNGSGDNLADNDIDADGTTLVAAVAGMAGTVGLPTAGDNGGLFTVNAGGTASFDPSGAFEALAGAAMDTSSVTVTIQDSAGNTADSTLTVTVNGANDAPSGADNTVSTGRPDPHHQRGGFRLHRPGCRRHAGPGHDQHAAGRRHAVPRYRHRQRSAGYR